MKYLKTYENITNFSVEVLTPDQFSELYHKIYPSYDFNLKHKIHFFDYNDMNTGSASKSYSESVRLITAYNSKDIIGVCKFAYWEISKHYSMSYLSVNNDYFQQGVSKKILEELFKYFKETYPGQVLHFTGYSIDGWKYLHKNVIELAKKYNVVIKEKPVDFITKWDDESRELFDKSKEEINSLYGDSYYENNEITLKKAINKLL